MLLSDDDRERLCEALKLHAAAGRIDLPELERRVAAIDAAHSLEQAAEVMADLPSWRRTAGAVQRPRGARHHVEDAGV